MVCTLGILAATTAPITVQDVDVWFDAGDRGTMFTDSAATVPVANDADPVVKWRSKGSVANLVLTLGAARCSDSAPTSPNTARRSSTTRWHGTQPAAPS